MDVDKSFSVKIDQDSWHNREIPYDISQLEAEHSISIDLALFCISSWMDDPFAQRGTIRDNWARKRYYDAISHSKDLRFVEGYDRLNSDSKRDFTEAIAVGFITALCMQKLSYLTFIKTDVFIRENPDSFRFSGSRNIKLPDYIAYDNKSDINIVECKGTCQSISVLDNAMNKGISQKKSLSNVGLVNFKCPIVAGLFIPKFSDQNSAILKIADPIYADLDEFFSRIPKIIVHRIFIRNTLAKFFFMMGFYEFSVNILKISPYKDEYNNLHNIVDKNWTHYIADHNGNIVRRRNRYVTVTYPHELFQRLVYTDKLNHEFDRINQNLIHSNWKFKSYEMGSVIESPFGFRFSIDRNEL